MGKIKQQTINSRIDFFYYAFRNILLAGLLLTIISGLVLSHLSIHSSATSSGTDSFTVNISTACTISSLVNNEHFINANIGTYNPDVGKTTITTLCNDGNGYSIYANGFSNNEEGNNKLINSTYPQYSIDTGLATSGLTSQWAMKLNNIENSHTPPTIDSGYNDTYGLVPNTWTKVAYRQSGTTDMSEGSSFTTTYSVYASSSQYNGTYVGQVKYVLLHPYRNDATIPITNFEDAFALNGKSKVDVNGTAYYTMQDMNSNICNSIITSNETPTIQLVDIRDNKIYWIAKLADGHCWMTENLDLDIGGVGVATLTSENTDISTNASVYASSGVYSDYGVSDGVYTWNPASTAVTSNYYLDGTTVKPSAWPTDNYTTPYSLEGGETYVYSSGNSNNDTKYTSLSDCATGGRTEAECKRYATGNYYNWTAAIASNNSTNLGSDPEVIAANSICPKGWRLPNASPVDNINNEFGRMLYYSGITASLSNGNESVGYASSGFDKLRYEPYYFVRSGGISGNSVGNTGANGDYWSNMVVDSNYAKSLAFYGTNIFPSRNGYRYLGRSIRCLAR